MDKRILAHIAVAECGADLEQGGQVGGLQALLLACTSCIGWYFNIFDRVEQELVLFRPFAEAADKLKQHTTGGLLQACLCHSVYTVLPVLICDLGQLLILQLGQQPVLTEALLAVVGSFSNGLLAVGAVVFPHFAEALVIGTTRVKPFLRFCFRKPLALATGLRAIEGAANLIHLDIDLPVFSLFIPTGF